MDLVFTFIVFFKSQQFFCYFLFWKLTLRLSKRPMKKHYGYSSSGLLLWNKMISNLKNKRNPPNVILKSPPWGCIFARVLLVDKMFLQVRQPGRELTTLPTYLTSHCILIFFFRVLTLFLFTMHTLYISTLHKDKGMRSMKCTSKILQKERKKWVTI